MNLQELLALPLGTVIQLSNGKRLLVEDKDGCSNGQRVCSGYYSGRKCHFIKSSEPCMKENCSLNGYDCGTHCYTIIHDYEPRPEYYVERGADAIAKERYRQILKEGWTEEHDAEHSRGELLLAAKCYLEANLNGYGPNNVPTDWPWDACWWKPECDQESIKNLKKAGALIAAEIDRLNKIKLNEVDAFEED